MVLRARANVARAGLATVEDRKGIIEARLQAFWDAPDEWIRRLRLRFSRT